MWWGDQLVVQRDRTTGKLTFREKALKKIDPAATPAKLQETLALESKRLRTKRGQNSDQVTGIVRPAEDPPLQDMGASRGQKGDREAGSAERGSVIPVGMFRLLFGTGMLAVFLGKTSAN